ncbi:MAG: type IV-A pilus assembly ATPase PilB [Candidatus Sumerlaeia bacterium]|nr:type IV-A pilus assembly ATPase PilB [Candidatus Sumerlaeia bacterium]
MATKMDKKLGDMLVKDGIISAEALENAVKEQERTKGALGQLLIDMGFTTEWQMAAALGKQLNVPFITLAHYDIDAAVLATIPADLVRKYKIVPVDKTGDTLMIALADPQNIYLLDELRILTRSQITPVISFESDILEAIRRFYPQNGAGSGGGFEEMLKEVSDIDITNMKEELDAGSLEVVDVEEAQGEDQELDDAPVIQLVNKMVMEALKLGASDIHVEPYEKVVRLRYRIDGVLQEMTSPPKKFQNALVSRIKIISDLDIAEKRLPQDGRFRLKVNGRNIDFRVSTCPMVFGEKVVIRILDQGNLMALSDLGFEPIEMEKLEKAIKMPWGMALITGPTGSGKSTTLYSALASINDPSKNISTCEDPVEYNLKGINQVPARADIGLTFARALKAFLRQDPDIIMIGEIRDLETGEIAIKAALTGHLVLSTLHTNDTASTIQRMDNMGIERFLITAALNLIEAQRLVRRVCKNCKREYKPEAALMETLGIKDPEATFAKGSGCDKCRHTGKKGRVGLYEIMSVSDNLRDEIMNGTPTNKLKKIAMDEGMRTLRGAGIHKCLIGVADIEDVLGATMADD